LASIEAEVAAGASRFCDEQIQIPSPKQNILAYRDALLDIASRRDVETILPVRPHDAYLFARYNDLFDPHVSLTTPSSDLLETVTDRLQLAAAAESADVAVPHTRLVTDVDDWSPELIVKSRFNLLTEESIESFGPHDVAEVNTIKHLYPGETPDVEVIIEEMNHVPIVQDYIRSADEYVFGALYDHGQPLATFQHRQIRGDSYIGGGGVYREAVSMPALEEAGRTLLDSLEYHGLACIEYMEDKETGEFVLTEINPRMWQSLPCAVQAGADFPYYYWLSTQGLSSKINHEYDVGVGSHLLYGELGYLLSILREESPLVDRPSLATELHAVLRSCYDMPRFDTLRADDPRPFLRGLKYVIEKKLT
jgi:predicted ATP-grasp superfamily ATP-dependent carboligase